MEATELPPDAKSPDNCPAGNMASASFRELLWEDKHGMEQLGWIKITASNEDEEAARTIIKKMRPDMEGTRHDTPPTQLEVTNDTHQRTLARSVPPTTSWLDEEHQKIFKTFMEAGVDLEAIIASCFSKEDPAPLHQPLRPVLFKCDGVKTSLYRVHPNADSISIFRPIGCDVGPENGMFMVYPCSDQLDMEDIQGPPTSIRIKSGELQEKATQLLLDRLQSFQDAISDRFDRLDQLNTEHGNNFNSILAKIDAKSAPKEPRKLAVRQLAKKDIIDIQKSKAKDKNIVTMQEQIPEPSEMTTEQGVPSGEDGELSIPVEHTTAAHKLLLWPSIRNLVRPREYDEDYVMELEERRGLIRVYGRGEGDETSEGNGLSPPPITLSTSFNENQPYHPASPTNGPWGVYVNQPQTKLENKGLDEDGMLTADPDMVRRYHKSYMKHMHQLHPFLDQSNLENKVDHFIRMYCPLKGPVRSPGVLNNRMNDMPRGAKRKRSCESLQGMGCDVQSTAEQGSGRRIEKSIHNAIILLVLALGSICEADPVPGPVTDQPVDFRKQKIPGPPTHDILSPAGSGSNSFPRSQGSGYVTESQASASPSLAGNRHSGVEGNPIPKDKNLDYIPGLAFYAYASEILGSLQGANGLPHIQAALLAGLYAGQLAHPFQSHGWIYQASRACQVLVRSKRYTQMPDGPDKDQYDFAYWTCFQLESDILAELDLPASGISRSEARISLPKGRFTLNFSNEVSTPNTTMMFYYSAQIYLRKVLNRVHTELYKVNKQGHTHWSSHIQEILSTNLELWRNSLPPAMRWKDTDPPSEELNVARMRAKYYGARYIIYRPLLYHALHYYGQIDFRALSAELSTEATANTASKSQQISPSLNSGRGDTNMARLSSDIGPVSEFTGIAHRDLPTKLRRACELCIDSAIRSTVAFDGIKGRPVVTNIFGTAHAYVNTL
ncbi:hypothetical protein G4B11_000204 [Aspergillus flavus]|nr:hypothetical protein G4B11_000204 [Aspergillus flavus]